MIGWQAEAANVMRNMETEAMLDTLQRPNNRIPRTYKTAAGTVTCSAIRHVRGLTVEWRLAYPPEVRGPITRREVLKMIAKHMETNLQ